MVDCPGAVALTHDGLVRGQCAAVSEAYLDGSVTDTDSRVARAGWGISFGPSADGGAPGFFGCLDGPQTAPAAELAALLWALRLTRGAIVLWTDCQLVHDGWHTGRLTNPSGPLARWWRRIAAALRERPEGATGVVLRKCYSHLDAASLAEVGQAEAITLGSKLADALAQRGAELAANEIAPRCAPSTSRRPSWRGFTAA